MLTLSQITSESFVSSVRTVLNVVTHGSHVHAPSRNSRTSPLSMRTSQRWSYASMLDTLVGVVTAIVLTIADVRLVHALAVLALVEVVRTRDLATLFLIRVILTIVRPVTMPRHRNANPGTLAPEVLLQITLIRLHRRTTQLITTVVTIRNAIALVRLLNALSQIVTLELVRQTRDRWTVLLVLLVEAIVIPITNPTLRNAVTRPRTRKLEVRTRLLRAEITLVRTIPAVVLAVTLPDVRNAAPILASKLGRRTRHVPTLELVRMITAVVLVVTAEVQRDAAARLALELVGTASWFCEKVDR